MKFFHLSDLHIGLKLFNRDLLEDQAFVLDEIVKAAKKEQPDAVVVAGDIYDRAVPSAEAVELFDLFLTGLSHALPQAQIMLISGNHDSGARLNVFRQILDRQNLHLIGLPPQKEEDGIERVTLTDEYGKVNFYLLPFVRPSMVRQIVGCDENGNNLSYDETVHRLLGREKIRTDERNVLVSHQFYLSAGKPAGSVARMDSEIRTVGDIDEVRADVLEAFDYAALGHIHKPMRVGRETARYCGTPLACSVSEAGQKKSILCVELREKGNCRIREIPLFPLREIRRLKGTLEEVLGRACGDYVTVTLTDQTDLNIFDLQDQLRSAFPNLLEIQRETDFAPGPGLDQAGAELDPFDLCCAFLGDPDEEERAMLQAAINAVKEGEP